MTPDDLAAGDPAHRRAALERLTAAAAPLDATSIPAVVACLAVPEKAVQRLAADLLLHVEAGARAAVAAALRTAMTSSDPHGRWGATWALGRLGIVEPAMIAPLLEALGARDGDQRWAAAELLTACARVHAEPVRTALLVAVGDPVPERRKMALYVLRDVGAAHPGVYAAAKHGLDDPAVGVRFAALAALVRLEPLPMDASALVLRLVRSDPDAGLRRAALVALGTVGFGVSDVTAALAAALVSDDPATRRAALLARRQLDAATR